MLMHGNHSMPYVIYRTPIPHGILGRSPYSRWVVFCHPVVKTLSYVMCDYFEKIQNYINRMHPHNGRTDNLLLENCALKSFMQQ